VVSDNQSIHMRVLNISTHDFSNMSHENANALRSVGVNCQDYSIHNHPYGYQSQSKKCTPPWIQDHYKEFDIIQVFHSDAMLYKIVRNHPNVVCYHTGTRYRENKQRFDELFKGRKIITDQCEFLLHNPTFEYLAPHTSLKPVKNNNKGQVVIGHYPSNHIVKGTKQIEAMLKRFKADFDIRMDIRLLPNADNLKRVSECDVYVELFAPAQNGKPYGCFGVSAFEATAMGCLVVTNNINRPAYEDVYGQQPFLTPDTEREFIEVIQSLKNRDYVNEVKRALHENFHVKHGVIETGFRIKELLEI